MKKADRRVYFDRRAGVVRRDAGEREGCDRPAPAAEREARWDRHSPLTWQEFIDRWERRIAAG